VRWAYAVGIGMTINPLRIPAAMAAVMTLAGLVRSRDRLMGIVDVSPH
jgi:ABC-2 type transport system permease protein